MDKGDVGCFQDVDQQTKKEYSLDCLELINGRILVIKEDYSIS